MLRNLLSGAAVASIIVMATVPASAGNRGEAPLLKGHSAQQQLLWARTSGQKPSAALVSAAAAEQKARGQSPATQAAEGQPRQAETAKPADAKAPTRQSRRQQARKSAAPEAGKAAPLPAARPAAADAATPPHPDKAATAAAPSEEAAPDKALKEGRATTTTALAGETTTPSSKSTTTAAVKTQAEPQQTADATPRGRLQEMVARHAAAAGIPFSLAHGVVMVESRYRPNATGPGGYIGLMQLSYRTAQGMGFKGTRKQLYDPETNIRYGVKYLAGAYRQAGGNKCVAVSKYQGGHGVRGVTKAGATYCAKVRRFIAQMPKDRQVQMAATEE